MATDLWKHYFEDTAVGAAAVVDDYIVAGIAVVDVDVGVEVLVPCSEDCMGVVELVVVLVSDVLVIVAVESAGEVALIQQRYQQKEEAIQIRLCWDKLVLVDSVLRQEVLLAVPVSVPVVEGEEDREVESGLFVDERFDLDSLKFAAAAATVVAAAKVRC